MPKRFSLLFNLHSINIPENIKKSLHFICIHKTHERTNFSTILPEHVMCKKIHLSFLFRTGINTKTKFDPYNNISKMMDIKIHVPIVTSEKTTSTSEEVVFVPNKSNIIRMRLEDGLCRGRLTGHFKSVTGLAFSPVHLELFSGSSDRAILVWDAQNLGAFEENLAEKNVKEPDRITVDAWSSSSSSEDES